MIRFIIYQIHLNICNGTMAPLMVRILVSILCVVAVSTTFVMTYLKLQGLIRELRMAHILEDEKKDKRR